MPNCIIVVKFEPKILNNKNGIFARAFQICSFSYKKSLNFILLSDLNTKFNLNAIKLSLRVKFDKEKYADTKRRPRLGRYLALQSVRYLRELLSCGRAGDGRRAARGARQNDRSGVSGGLYRVPRVRAALPRFCDLRGGKGL